MLYGIVIRSACARGWLWTGPLLRALEEGRPCVLISPLDPDSDDFERVLRAVPGGATLLSAVEDGRLRVLLSIGDYSVNLFRQGASGFLRELEGLQADDSTLFVVDQADDLFTAHDPRATQEQAAHYRRWCEAHGHTMVLLFLRVTLLQPLMGGNQAALTYLDGLADASVGSRGLLIQTEFWNGPDHPQAADVEALGAWPATAAHNTAASSRPNRNRTRTRVWYVGPEDRARSDRIDQVDWQIVESLDPLFDEHAHAQHAVVVLDRSTDLDLLLLQLQSLRARMGPQACVILRENGFRLREYPQRLMLMAAGADAIVAHDETLNSVVDRLADPHAHYVRDSACRTADLDDPGLQSLVWLQHAPGGRLPLAGFLEEVENMLEHSERWHIPCTLAEVRHSREDFAMKAHRHGASMRTGDLSAQSEDTELYFLQGCRPRDAVRVIERLLEEAGLPPIPDQVNLYGGLMGVRSRLLTLQSDAARSAPAPRAGIEPQAEQKLLQEHAGRNPRPLSRAAAVTAVAVGLSFLLMSAPTPGLAQGSGALAPASSQASFSEAFASGRYSDAARLGLAELQRRPDDHDTRLKVGHSLAWTGQYGRAQAQYRMLLKTPLAADARVGLGNIELWTSRPHAALALFRAALAADPQHAGAKEAIARAMQTGRPKTLLRGSRISDSSDTERNVVRATHFWADGDLLKNYAVRVEKGSEDRLGGVDKSDVAELGIVFEHRGLNGSPRVDLSIQDGPKTRLFGEGMVRFADDMFSLRAGRINWGAHVFNAQARRAGLTANVVGLSVQHGAGWADLIGSASSYSISDGNRVGEASLRMTPTWQPLPASSGIRLFAGLSARNARQVDPRYWSPRRYSTAEVGGALSRDVGPLQISGELKRSFRLGGDAANGWSFGVNVAYRINEDWTLRADASQLQTQRDGSGYKARNLHLGLQRSW